MTYDLYPCDENTSQFAAGSRQMGDYYFKDGKGHYHVVALTGDSITKDGKIDDRSYRFKKAMREYREEVHHKFRDMPADDARDIKKLIDMFLESPNEVVFFSPKGTEDPDEIYYVIDDIDEDRLEYLSWKYGLDNVLRPYDENEWCIYPCIIEYFEED